MSIISLICKQCGAPLEVDDSGESGSCPSCGTKIVLRDEVVNITHNHIKHVHGETSADYIQKARAYVTAGDYELAQKEFLKAITASPGDWRVYMEMVKFLTADYTNTDDEEHLAYLEKAKRVGSAHLDDIEKIYAPFAQAKKARSNALAGICKMLIALSFLVCVCGLVGHLWNFLMALDGKSFGWLSIPENIILILNWRTIVFSVASLIMFSVPLSIPKLSRRKSAIRVLLSYLFVLLGLAAFSMMCAAIINVYKPFLPF